jgi:hypothetical protein
MMDRRQYLRRGCVLWLAWLSAGMLGCRGHQYGHVLKDEQADMVGSHTAGAETFNPLINEAVAKLLGRQETIYHQAGSVAGELPSPPKRVCFVGVENHSAEEVGDFKEQIYEQIDTQIVQTQAFSPVSRRFVAAGLRQTRLRPDDLFLPDNAALFASILAQQGQPFDYLLFAKLTSGTTQANHDYQRDYVLTLELVNLQTGQFDKESARIRKGYHKTRLGKWRKYNPFARG